MKREQTLKIVIHCSNTPVYQKLELEELRQRHLDKGFSDICYHHYIRRDGTIELGLEINEIGEGDGLSEALQICYEGGLNESDEPEDTRTAEQKNTLFTLVSAMNKIWFRARPCGHRDLFPDRYSDGSDFMLVCPCYDVEIEHREYHRQNREHQENYHRNQQLNRKRTTNG